MDELEYLQVPEPATSITDVHNLIQVMKDGDLVCGGDDEDKLHEILSMAINIVHMNVSLEMLETAATYKDVMVGLRRSSIQKV